MDDNLLAKALFFLLAVTVVNVQNAGVYCISVDCERLMHLRHAS